MDLPHPKIFPGKILPFYLLSSPLLYGTPSPTTVQHSIRIMNGSRKKSAHIIEKVRSDFPGKNLAILFAVFSTSVRDAIADHCTALHQNHEWLKEEISAHYREGQIGFSREKSCHSICCLLHFCTGRHRRPLYSTPSES